MRFTTGAVRALVADQRGYVTARLAPQLSDADRRFSPQRVWMRAAMRAYFESGRDPATLLRDFATRVGPRPLSRYRAGIASSGAQMLDLLLSWDAFEPSPRVAFHAATDREVGRHVLSMQHDLIYEVPNGYLVREVWTDGTISPSHPRMRVMAAAALLHAEAEYLDVWHLRGQVKLTWSPPELETSRAELVALLDDVARQLEVAHL